MPDRGGAEQQIGRRRCFEGFRARAAETCGRGFRPSARRVLFCCAFDLSAVPSLAPTDCAAQASAALLQWTNFVFRIRCFASTGPFIRMTVVSVRDTAMFLVLFCVAWIAFAQVKAKAKALTPRLHAVRLEPSVRSGRIACVVGRRPLLLVEGVPLTAPSAAMCNVLQMCCNCAATCRQAFSLLFDPSIMPYDNKLFYNLGNSGWWVFMLTLGEIPDVLYFIADQCCSATMIYAKYVLFVARLRGATS